MATVNPTRTILPGNAVLYTWTPFVAGDTCAPVDLTDCAIGLVQSSMQVSGTFGATPAAIELLGSNNGVDYSRVALYNLSTFEAAGITDVMGSSRYIKPSIAVSDAALNVAISILVRFGGFTPH